MRIVVLIALVISIVGCGIPQSSIESSEQSFEQLFPIKRTNKDSTIKVTKPELIYLIKKGTSNAEQKKIETFSDDEHILAIMLLNSKSLYIPGDENELNVEYAKFSERLIELEYARTLGETLEWMPNRGMGMYFPKLDIDYGGGKMFGWGFFELK